MTSYKIDFAHLTVIAVNKNGEEINCGEACTNVEELLEFIAELAFDRGEFSWEVAAELIDSLHHTVLAAHAGELTEHMDDELLPKEFADGWALLDSSNQLWWPDDNVQATILASEDPRSEILQAYLDGADGEWCS